MGQLESHFGQQEGRRTEVEFLAAAASGGDAAGDLQLQGPRRGCRRLRRLRTREPPREDGRNVPRQEAMVPL